MIVLGRFACSVAYTDGSSESFGGLLLPNGDVAYNISTNSAEALYDAARQTPAFDRLSEITAIEFYPSTSGTNKIVNSVSIDNEIVISDGGIEYVSAASVLCNGPLGTGKNISVNNCSVDNEVVVNTCSPGPAAASPPAYNFVYSSPNVESFGGVVRFTAVQPSLNALYSPFGAQVNYYQPITVMSSDATSFASRLQAFVDNPTGDGAIFEGGTISLGGYLVIVVLVDVGLRYPFLRSVSFSQESGLGATSVLYGGSPTSLPCSIDANVSCRAVVSSVGSFTGSLEIGLAESVDSSYIRKFIVPYRYTCV